MLITLAAAGRVNAQSGEVEWAKDGSHREPEHPKPVSKEQQASQSILPKWSASLDGGYGYRLFRTGKVFTTAANQRYIKDFRSGIAFGGNVAYFPWPRFGFGVRYERYQSKATWNDLTEDVTIQHLSGLLTHRSVLKNQRTFVLTSLMVGYQPYQNKTSVGAEQFTLNGKTAGWGVSVGLQHRLGEKFAFNVTGSAMMGAIYRLQRKTEISSATLHLSKDNSVDLSRFSLTVGLGFLK
ncbi:hypothetical protein [Dyadobacter luticola]|nr:hypothetical protein [Dyadobacter luticola]